MGNGRCDLLSAVTFNLSVADLYRTAAVFKTHFDSIIRKNENENNLIALNLNFCEDSVRGHLY